MFSQSTQRVLCWFFFSAGFAWIVYLGVNSPGTPVQDEIGHFLLSKSAWQYPILVLNVWGRPANTLFYMLPAIGGLGAARLFSIGTASVVVWLATRVAQHLNVRHLFLIPLLLWFQPWFANLSYAVITEIPFSIFMIGGIYFAKKERLWWASMFWGLLPLVRHEGIALTVIWIVYVFYKRKWLGALIAIAPLIAYNLIYYFTFQRWPFTIYLTPNSVNWYGSGDWLHFVSPLILNVGLPIFFLSLMSISTLVKLRSKAMLFFPYLFYFAVHTFLYRFGLFASGGYDLFLLPIAPAFAITAALGFEFILEIASHGLSRLPQRSTVLLPRALIILLGVVVVLFCVTQIWPRPADQEEIAAEQSANWLHAQQLANSPVLSTHIWFTYFFFGMMTPEQVGKEPLKLDAMLPGTILVWDQHYSPRWGYDYNYLSNSSSGWQLLKEFNNQTFAIFRRLR